MNLPIRAKYKLTSAEIKAAAKASLKYGSPFTRGMKYAAIIFILVFLVSLFYSPALVASAAPLLPLALVFLFAGDLAICVTLYKFRCNPHKDTEICWSFDEEGFTVEGDGVTTTSSWRKVFRLLDTPRGFVLYPSKGLIQWIPATAFENAPDIATVREIAKSKVMKYQKKV